MLKKEENNKRLEGIGGWLLFFIIILILGSVAFLISVFRNLFLLADPSLRILIANPVLNVLSIIFASILIILAIISLVFIFKKKKKAINWVTIALIFDIFHSIVWYYFLMDFNMWIFAAIFDTTFDIIFLCYFRKSQRVKNTLVN